MWVGGCAWVCVWRGGGCNVCVCGGGGAQKLTIVKYFHHISEKVVITDIWLVMCMLQT